eukprot:TRINITY_DN3079_c0_g3_i1.p1 TRINITY_DN3079_c0_g3~~TRINITY_DN3079_c0_g3_i1.p1  ORF type:complete len:325 (+),score=50.46 TRINITY_DN3079_c0_g3_i1:78-1052(+)
MGNCGVKENEREKNYRKRAPPAAIQMRGTRPVIRKDMIGWMDAVAAWIAKNCTSNYCISYDWDPELWSAMYEAGFAVISSNHWGNIVVTPKLHCERMISNLSRELHISKKHAKSIRQHNFIFSVNTNLEETMDRIVQQHGENWLYPPVQKVFKELNQLNKHKVRVISIEIRTNGKLVAGELGMILGCCYSSLTGFADVAAYPGSGTLQIIALATLLKKCGYRYWDLGMHIQYKEDFCTTILTRGEYLPAYRQFRELKPDYRLDALADSPVSDFLKRPAAPAPAVANPRSKNQMKKEAKLARLRSQKECRITDEAITPSPSSSGR